jgi:hypothetical protein
MLEVVAIVSDYVAADDCEAVVSVSEVESIFAGGGQLSTPISNFLSQSVWARLAIDFRLVARKQMGLIKSDYRLHLYMR